MHIAEAIKKIVFVDDDVLGLNTYRRCMRNTDYDVQYFTSPKKAIKYIENNEVMLLVSDERMPEMLGHELINKVNGKCTSVLLTGYATDKVSTLLPSGVKIMIKEGMEEIRKIKEIAKHLAMAGDKC